MIIDQSSINEYQTDTGQDTGDYIETTSTTGSTAFKLNSASEKHSPSLNESSKGGTAKNSYFVPLAGPVYIPSDLRYLYIEFNIIKIYIFDSKRNIIYKTNIIQITIEN